jgi:hypothetical protein
MFRGSYAAFGVVLGSIKLLYSKWIRRRLLKVLKAQVCKSFYCILLFKTIGPHRLIKKAVQIKIIRLVIQLLSFYWDLIKINVQNIVYLYVKKLCWVSKFLERYIEGVRDCLENSNINYCLHSSRFKNMPITFHQQS